MNYANYRLVWSVIRKMLVPVGETVTGHCGGKKTGSRAPAARCLTLFAMRHVAFAALAVFGPAWAIAGAQATESGPGGIAPSGPNAPGIVSTANGIPQVNITKPSSAGVSQNTYSQFDVQRPGVILNNSSVITNTQQAGQINGNPNFGPNDAARIILNQVNSATPSQLRGYIEVAGNRASVVVANPSGIVVDGGGFVNTTRGILTTGSPVLDAAGNLGGFNVTGGSIAVQGEGFNPSNIDQVDLIARAVQVNAALYGNTLNVVAGANQVAYPGLNATPIGGGVAPPAVSIDVSQLGGMYANRITLVGTEHGVGVNNAGVVAAQAGDLTLTTQGQLVQSGSMTASGNFGILADSVVNSGIVYAQQATAVDATGTLTNNGTLAARQDTSIRAGRVASTGLLGAGIDSDGTPGGSGNLSVSAAGLFAASGQNVAAGAASLDGGSMDLSNAQTWAGSSLNLTTTGGSLSLAGAKASAGSTLTANAAGALDTSGATLGSGADMQLSGAQVANTGGQVVAGGALSVQTAGAFANQQGVLQAAGRATLNTGSIDNTAGHILSLHGDGLMVSATGALTNGAGGEIGGNGDVTIHAGQIVNAGTLTAMQNLVADASQTLTSSGTLAANGSVNASAGSTLTSSGTLLAGTQATVSGSTIDNSGGTLDAARLVLQADNLTNRSGTIVQTGTGPASINVTGTLDNTSGSLRTNSADLTLRPGTLINDGGTITNSGTGTLSVSTGALSNNGGTLATNGTETIRAGSVSNQGGVLSAVGTQSVTSSNGGIDNSAGGYIGGQSVNVDAASGRIDNTTGTIEALDGTASVSAQALTNDSGTLHALGAAALKVSTTQALRNRNGLIGGDGDVTITAGSLDNSNGTLISAADLSVDSADSLTNDGGVTGAAGNLNLTAGNVLSNAGGQIAAVGAASQMNVSGASVDNTAGSITNAGTGALSVTAANTVINAGASALIAGNGDVGINAATLSNTQSATVSAAGSLGLNLGARLVNDGGALTSGGALALDELSATVSNAGGSISGGAVTLNSASLDNTAGQIANYAGSNGSVAIQTGTLTNAGGSIGSSLDLAVRASSLQGNGTIVAGRDAAIHLQGDYAHEAASEITANHDLVLTTTGTLTNEGTLGAAGNATLNAANVVNTAGARIGSGNPGDPSTGTTTVNATTGAIRNAGTIEGSTVATDSATLENTGTVLGYDVTVNAGSLLNDGAAAIIAGADTVSLWVRDTVTNQNNAMLYSLGNLNIAADGTTDANGNLVHRTGTLNNLSSTIEAGNNLNVAANQINNVRQNIQTTGTSTTQTYVMKELPWWKPGQPGNTAPFQDANTYIGNAYYLNPADIVSIKPVVTPDGYIVQEVVVNLPANASVFEWKQGGLSYSQANGGQQVQFGEQSRLTPAAGQVTLYVYSIETGQANPDQTGGTAWPQHANDTIQNLLGTITYSSAYGDCTTNCIRLETFPDYTDPTTQIIKSTEQRRGGSGPGSLPVEVERRVTETITATTLSPDSGAPAILTSGGAMNINVGTQLNNDNGTIAVGGDLTVNGTAGASSAAISNTATQLGTTYSFVNSSGYGSPWNADPMQPVEWVEWTNPSITLATGTAGGTVTSNQAVTITGGEVTNAGVTVSSVPTGAAAPADLTAPTLGGSGTGTIRQVGDTRTTAFEVTLPDGTTTGTLAPTLPTNGLYSLNPAPGASYLVETNPRFTSYTKFISSDYMLDQLGLNPQSVQKRLGDGLYEQQLVRNQITQLTGRVYLEGHSNHLDEYQALMTAGATVAQQFRLTVGIALTDVQMAALTSDIVWLVSQTVALADGTTQQVLVPQVYLAGSGNVNLQPAGALIAGNSVSIQGDDVTNRNAAITGNRNVVLVANNNILNSGGLIAGANVGLAAGNDIVAASVTGSQFATFASGTSAHTSVAGVSRIVSAGDTQLLAGHDLTLAGALVSAGRNLGLQAGNAIGIGTIETGSTVSTASGSQNTMTRTTQNATGSSLTAGGTLGAISGGDISVTGSALTSGSDMVVVAAGDVTVKNATSSSSVDTHGTNKGGWQSSQFAQQTNHASALTSGGSVSVLAGAQQDANGNVVLPSGGPQKDLTVQGSAIVAGTNGEGNGTVLLGATGDVNIGATQLASSLNDTSHQSSRGFLSRRSSDSQTTWSASQAAGSLVSGDAVGVVAKNDINVEGSAVAGTTGVTLNAERNVNITAAQDTVTQSTYYHESRSGLMGSGGLGFTIGSREQTARTNGQSVTESQARSMVGAVQGNVAVTAGADVHIGGSDIVAGKAANDTTGATGNIVIAGQNVTIDPGLDTAQQHDQREARSSGLSVGITNTPLDTARNVRESAASGNAYQRTTNVLTSIGSSLLDTPSPSISYGRSSSSSTSDAGSSVYTGSTVQAVGNVSLIATGGAQRDAAGSALDGDLTVTGSTVAAGGTATLHANRNVTLQASTDQYTQSSSSSSSSSGFSLATPSPGDMVRWISGAPNNDGVGPSPYNAASASSNGNGTVTQQTPTVVTGNDVVVTSRTGDIDVIGSGIAGTQGVSLDAVQGNINVLAGMETATSHRESSARQLGSLGSNGTGTGFSVGVASSHTVQDSEAQTQSTVRSQIVSTQGDVSLDAKQNVTVVGADLSAANDLMVKGANVSFDPGADSLRNSSVRSSSQWGVTVALGGVTGDTIAAVNSGMNSAASGGDARLAALNGAKAALTAYGTQKAVQAASQGSAPALVKATVSAGGGTSRASEQDSSVTNAGSTLAAGRDLAVIATGSGAAGTDGRAADGDIVAHGTQISARNVTLDAARDIDLASAKDTTQLNSSNSSGSFGVGIGASLGGSQNGLTAELSAAGAKGMAEGTSTTNRDTQVSASDTLTMTSGRDTTLAGAQVSGGKVAVEAGRNLTIASQQDTATYDSKQASAGFSLSVCVPPLCYGQTVAGNASASGQSVTNDYESVNRQSGIYAGDGGFEVNVGNHTQLDGGAISGTATPGKNSLTTQTLGYTNLENHAEYSGTAVGFSAATNGQPGKASLGIASLGPTGFGAAGTGDSASGTTYAAVSPGTITVRDDAGTGQDSTAGLSRDPAHANGSVADRFNAQDVQNDLAVQQLGAQVGMQVAGDVADHLAKSDPSLWGADGAGRTGIHALVAGGMAALGGGNVAGAVAGTVAGDLASSAAAASGNVAGNLVAGAAGAVAGAAVGGGTGAVSGANGALAADLYNRQLHEDSKAKEQTLAQKLADESGGRYTVQQIEEQMAQMDLVMSNGGVLPGNVLVASGDMPQDGTAWTQIGVNRAGQPVWSQSLGPGDPDLQAYIVKGAQGSGFSYQATATGSNPGLFRLPDFVNFQVDYFVGSVWGTFTRDGNSFFGYGVNAALPNTVNATASVQFGWLNQTTVRPGQTNNFMSGYAGSGTAAFAAVGGGIVYSPGNGTATTVGIGAGANLGKTNNPASTSMGYTVDQGQTGIRW